MSVTPQGQSQAGASRAGASRRALLLRLNPAVHDALARWAAEDLRSLNAHIEYLLRQSLAEAGRLPRNLGGLPTRGRPRKRPPVDETP